MLSLTSDYALRAVLVLARAHDGAPMPADAIADAIGAPRNYLSKTLHALARAGLVRSARGPTGGYALAVAPGELALARVVAVFDAPREAARCLLGARACDPAHPCAAHHRWTAIADAQRAPLASTMVADLLSAESAEVR